MKLPFILIIAGLLLIPTLFSGENESKDGRVAPTASTLSNTQTGDNPTVAGNVNIQDKPDEKNPSRDALEASAYFYVYLDKNNLEARDKFISKFSEGTNDVKKAIINYAFMLDENPDIMSNVKSLVGISGTQNRTNYQEEQNYPSSVQETSPVKAATDVCNCKGYDGPGGACYSGPGGAAYDGPGGPAYSGPGGPCYDGPGGPEYAGPGGPAYDGPGGPRYSGPGGPAYDGPGGAAYDGPGGPCYDGPGGPCYSGPGGGGSCPSVCR